MSHALTADMLVEDIIIEPSVKVLDWISELRKRMYSGSRWHRIYGLDMNDLRILERWGYVSYVVNSDSDDYPILYYGVNDDAWLKFQKSLNRI